MKHLFIIVAATLITLPASAALYDAYQLDNLYENESVGLRFYEAGDYRSAFGLLKETAAKGMKRSQYILGFMFMKGEGVDKNVLIGLAWLGLATEADDKGWQETYDNMYNTLNDAQKSMVDDKVNEYREKFGATAQGVTCAQSAVVGSRKIGLICRKSEGSYVEYDIEVPIRP